MSKVIKAQGQDRTRPKAVNAIIRCFVNTGNWNTSLDIVRYRLRRPVTEMERVEAIAAIVDHYPELIELIQDPLIEDVA
jgi:hypothetical protein